ncbi:MAG: hypothetical protein XD91_1328 [Clostridiales bacterium 38_11]|nr:MAG: hypothetical protein XD91_1328 [Clostridiales bacterium 38_11]
MKDITIKVISTQASKGKNPLITELITEGNFYMDDGQYCFEYIESEISGMEGSVTRLISDGDKKLTMKRNGVQASALLEFQEGEKSKSSYITEYGTFAIILNTTKVESTIDQFGRGKINLEYRMTFGTDSETINKLEITIR